MTLYPFIPIGSPLLNVAVFVLVLLSLLYIVRRVFRPGTASSRSTYYTTEQGFTGPENGLALAGDFLSAATFLGIVGAVAVAGPDGFGYAVAAFVAWLLALFFVAELIRNTGRFTLADVLTARLRERPVRAAAATTTIVISTMFLVSQLSGAGGLIALLLDISDRPTQSLVIAIVGGLMTGYVLICGMSGTTWLQMAKALLLIVTGAVMTAYVLGIFALSIPKLLDSAAARHPAGDAILKPGLLYGNSLLQQADMVSLAIGGVLGVAALPHIMMRFYTVPNARQARASASWAIWLIGGFFLLTLVLGYGATALVGPQRILGAPGGTNSAAPLLALEIGGELGLATVSAIAFATILASVAGVAVTAAATFAHDVYANLLRRGWATATEEVRVARWATVGVGVLGTTGAVLANGQNLAFVVSLTFTAAASANLPTLLFSLFWRRFTTAGALCSMYGGLAITLVLIVFSPTVSGTPDAMLPDVDIAWFPLSNPGLVSVPAGFLLGIVGSLLSRERPDRLAYAQMSVRALTGAGVERRVPGDPSLPPPAGRHRNWPRTCTSTPVGENSSSAAGAVPARPRPHTPPPAPARPARPASTGPGTGAFFRSTTPSARGSQRGALFSSETAAERTAPIQPCRDTVIRR